MNIIRVCLLLSNTDVPEDKGTWEETNIRRMASILLHTTGPCITTRALSLGLLFAVAEENIMVAAMARTLDIHALIVTMAMVHLHPETVGILEALDLQTTGKATTTMNMVATTARTLDMITDHIITGTSRGGHNHMVTLAKVAPHTLPLEALGTREALDIQTTGKATNIMTATR